MKGTWQITGSSSGSGVALVVIIAVVILADSGAAIASALEAVLITLGSTVALGVIGGIAYLVYRARSDSPRRPVSARVAAQIPLNPRPRLEEPSNPAIEPAREVHLHLNVSPDQLAAIVRHYTEGNQP